MDFIAGDMDIGVFSRLWKKTEKKSDKQTPGRRDQGQNRNEPNSTSSGRRDSVASWRDVPNSSLETLDGAEVQRSHGMPESSWRGSLSSIYSATSDAPAANSRRSNMDQWNLSMELAMTQVTSDITSLRHFCKEMVSEMNALKTVCAEMSSERQSVVDLCQELTSRLQSQNEDMPNDDDIFPRSPCPDLIEKSQSSESQLKHLSDNISEIKQSVAEISKNSVLLKSEISSQQRIVRDECQSIATDHVYLKKICEELISQSQKAKKGDKNKPKGEDFEKLYDYVQETVHHIRSDIQNLQKDMHQSEKQWPKLIRTCVLEAKDDKQKGLLNQLAQMETSLIEIQTGQKQGSEAMLRKVESIVDKSARKVLNESKVIFKEQAKEDKTFTNDIEEKKDPCLDFSVKKILHGAKKSANDNQLKDLKICFGKDGSRRSEEMEKELELSQITFKKQSVLKSFDLASDDINGKGRGDDTQSSLNQTSQNAQKKEFKLSIFEPPNDDITRNTTRFDFLDIPMIKSKPTTREVSLATSPRPARVFKSNSLIKDNEFNNFMDKKSEFSNVESIGKIQKTAREVIIASSPKVTKFFGPYPNFPAENINQPPISKKSESLDMPTKNFMKFKPNAREVIIAEGSFPQKIFRPRSLSTNREGHISSLDTSDSKPNKVKPTQREVIIAPKSRSRAQSEDRPTKRRPRAKSADRTTIMSGQQSSSSSSPVDDVIVSSLPGVRETEHRRLWQICNIKSLCRTQMVKLGPSIRVQELDLIFQCFFQKNWTLVLKLAPKSPEQFDRVVHWPMVVKVVVELIEDVKSGIAKLLCQKDVVIPRKPKHDIEALAIDSVSRKRLSPQIDKDDIWLRVKAYPADKKPGQ